MDFSNFWDVVFRSIISLLVLFLVAKLIGKKQVSELSVFDYVIGISIGNFAAEMTINLDSPAIDGIVAVLIFGLVAYLGSYVSMKSIFFRRTLIGTPTMIIQEGKILKRNMKRLRLDMNDLLQEARVKGYFDLSEIKYGVMEVNGEMSFLPFTQYRPATVKDLKTKPADSTICANVIIDGKVMTKNLQNMGKNEEWLTHELKVNGNNLDDILLCTLDSQDKLVIYLENMDVKPLDVLE